MLPVDIQVSLESANDTHSMHLTFYNVDPQMTLDQIATKIGDITGKQVKVFVSNGKKLNQSVSITTLNLPRNNGRIHLCPVFSEDNNNV